MLMTSMRKRSVDMVKNLFKTVSIVGFAILIVLCTAGFLVVQRFMDGLPSVAALKTFHPDVATEVFSDEGIKIGEFSIEKRYPVKFETVPKHVIQSFLAAEDAKFYEHGGIDLAGIARAGFANLVRGRFAQGGSTITQQVARNFLLTRKKELIRKVKELILAVRLERELNKNEILALYMNEIYLGHGAHGVAAAAANYFNKKVEDLTIAEGAMLAGLAQRPYEWDPFHRPYEAKRRQLYVIKRMAEEKFITEADRKKAEGETLKLYALEDLNNSAAPYFVEYVRQHLMEKYGSANVLNQGFKVYTTVRYPAQKAAERSVERGLRVVDKRMGWRGVPKKVASAEDRQKIFNQVHELALEKATRVRLLPSTVDSKTTKLLYDLSTLESSDSPYFGITPVAEGKYYQAVITEVDDAKGLAAARVGQTPVILPLSTMDWVKINDKPARAISQILAVNDVVEVRIAKIDRKDSLVLADLEQEPEVQAALLAYDISTGHVRAMVGGANFEKSKFNRALQAKRQVGSTFKPLIYAAALDKGFSPSSLVSDAPLVFKMDAQQDADDTGGDWRPKNYSGKFEGDIPLRYALIHSMNVPSVKVLDQIGLKYAIQYARTLGITTTLPEDLSIGLGSWSTSLEEIMRAYAIFPRLGKPVVLNYIKKVVDENGKVLEEMPAEAEAKDALAENPGAIAGQVISPQTAYVMTDMLKGVVREGTGHPASVIGVPMAGKTGTSNDQKDAWFVGYTPYVMAGVWVGLDQEKPLATGETGGHASAPIWAEFMQEAIKPYAKGDFPIPDDIVFAYVDKRTGKLASAKTAGRVRVAYKIGTVPDATGSNIARIGEPGVRATSTTNTPTAEVNGGSPSGPNPEANPGGDANGGARVAIPQGQDESNDYLREGYEDN
jgi:penicillin-binding protein 1A